MTIIEGDTGLILIDPLLSNETAKAALDLYLANRPAKTVAAVIYTHSHADHFGGAKGVISHEDAASGKVKVIAPDGFMEHAPAEMIMYFPQFRLLNMAEDATHTMHNLYTIRGAEIRDGRLWSRYIADAIERYGERTDAVIAQHHWPIWGNARVVAFLKKQRDL